MDLAELVQLLLVLGGGSILGKNFLDRYLSNRQQHKAGMEEAVFAAESQERRARLDKEIRDHQAQRERQTTIIAAMVEMVKSQQDAQMELTRAALEHLGQMISNIVQLGAAVDGHRRDDENRFVYTREQLRKMDLVVAKLEESSEQLGSLIKVLGNDY